MLSNIKFAAKTTFIILLMCGASTLLTFIQLTLFGIEHSNLLMMNPLTSGYLHLSVVHLVSNAIILFLALCSDTNKEFNAIKIFYVTIIIELIYLPVEIINLSQIAIGISGTGYFLVSRYFFSWKEKTGLGVCIIFLLTAVEINGMFPTSVPDDAAHLVHFIGIVLGYISFVSERKNSFKLLNVQKIN